VEGDAGAALAEFLEQSPHLDNRRRIPAPFDVAAIPLTLEPDVEAALRRASAVRETAPVDPREELWGGAAARGIVAAVRLEFGNGDRRGEREGRSGAV
jgi:hypothetical protein